MRNYSISILFGFFGAALFHLFQLSNGRSVTTLDSKVVTASQFALVDTTGRVRAQLGFSSEGPPGLWILDEKGVARIAMGLYPDNTSHFGLQDKNGAMIQLMRSVGPSESPLLIFKNKGEDRMILGLNSSQTDPFFVAYDKSNHKKTIFSGFSDGP